MTPQALEALKQSIKRWEYKLSLAKEGRYEDIHMDARYCPLCMLYFTSSMGHCVECPVYERTQKKTCSDTPYAEASNLLHMVVFSTSAVRDPVHITNLIMAIEQEIAFLQSLLPEG